MDDVLLLILIARKNSYTMSCCSLNNNDFRGFLPSEISNLVGLGKMPRLWPQYFRKSATDQYLNRFQPYPLLEDSLNVANNQLEGTFPREWVSIAGLRELDISHNQLSGEIPYLIDGMKNLRLLNMAHNHFSGSIPPELGR